MASKLIARALQGGGSHGAYTWGVLDRLLQEPQLEFEALSGASAGAINAAVLASGYIEGGRDGARAALRRFWEAVGEKMSVAGGAALSDPAAQAYLSLTRYFSPSQLNPLNVNPLRDVLAEQIDFERLRAASRIKLFISTTRVRDGSLRLFTQDDVTLDALLASACLPSIHHTVEIDGEPYWDGALTANPPISTLVYQCRARDILVVILDPAREAAAPTSAEAIGERLKQLNFSSSLSTELHSIALATAHARRARFSFGALEWRLRRLNLQVMEPANELVNLDPHTRFNVDMKFLNGLCELGRRAAEGWIGSSAGDAAPTRELGGELAAPASAL